MNSDKIGKTDQELIRYCEERISKSQEIIRREQESISFNVRTIQNLVKKQKEKQNLSS